MDRRAVNDISQNIILESRASADRVDYALKAGLAKNRNKLDYYRRAVANGNAAVRDSALRPYAGELLEELLYMVFNDQVMWNRMKLLLSRRRGSGRGLREDVSDRGLRSLVEKSIQREVPLEVILEVYSRGAALEGERGGFTRVDSFLAGGRAREMDSDLIEEEIREIPEAPRNNKTLDTVKRVLKGRAR